MANNPMRELTAKEEKLLANPKLTAEQRLLIRQFWQENEPPKTKWYLYLGYIVNPLLIAGLIYLIFSPENNIRHLIFFYCWLMYPLSILFAIFAVATYLLADFARKNTDPENSSSEIQAAKKKLVYETLISQNHIERWAGKNLVFQGLRFLETLAVIILLAYNGFIATAILATLCNLSLHGVMTLLKSRTQACLDDITKNYLTYATDETGSVILGEVIRD